MRVLMIIALGALLGVGLLLDLVPMVMHAFDGPPERSDAELRELFVTRRSTFERLRDHVRVDSGLEVRSDSYSYCDGCPPDTATGRPPGVAEQACDWHGGCSRWVNEPPTAEVLAGIWHISQSRAQGYIDDLARVGGLRVREEPDGSVVIWMASRGIVTSGSATMIAWTPPEAEHHPSDQILDDRWSIRVE